MKKIEFKIELTYDEKIWHGNNKLDKEWFFSEILNEGKLQLYSEEAGDVVGSVKILGNYTKEQNER